jgi:Mn2+/Fe2+ NRAMP family transporter
MSQAATTVSVVSERTTSPSAVGPGIIFALSAIGAGDFVSNSAIGATFGTALLWILAVALACRYVWVECCARYVLATGQTPYEGFAQISRVLLWVVLFTLIAHRHIHGLGKVLYMGSSIHLLAPLPSTQSSAIWSLFFVAIGFSMTYWSSYRTLERIFKMMMALMTLALAVVVVLVPPSFTDVLRGLFIPSLPAASGPYSPLLLITALLGTEACSLSNVNYAYFMWQKGWRDMSYSGRQRRDLMYGVAALFFTGALLQIASAGTIGRGGVAPRTVEDLVQIFSTQLGATGRVIFALGIWAAVFTSFVGGIRGYSMSVADVARNCNLFKTGMFARPADGQPDRLVRAFIVLFSFSPLYILATPAKPVWLVLVASASVITIVPIISFALLRLTSDERIMGEHRNHWISNVVLAFVGLVASFLLYKNAVSLWNSWSG